MSLRPLKLHVKVKKKQVHNSSNSHMHKAPINVRSYEVSQLQVSLTRARNEHGIPPEINAVTG